MPPESVNNTKHTVFDVYISEVLWIKQSLISLDQMQVRNCLSLVRELIVFPNHAIVIEILENTKQ